MTTPLSVDYNAGALSVAADVREVFLRRADAEALGAAQKQIAEALHADVSDFVFTSGGTENNARVLWACAWLYPGAHVLVSSFVHASVRATVEYLRAQKHLEVTFLDWEGMQSVAEHVLPHTRLCVLGAVCNETGVCLPVAHVCAQLRAHQVHVHVDAVQALGRIPVDVGSWGCGSLGVSAHKVGGVVGTGALWVRRSSLLASRLGVDFWGEHHAQASVCAWAQALKNTPSSERVEAVRQLRDGFERAIQQHAPCGVSFVGSSWPRVANVSLAWFKGCHAESLLVALDMHGFAASAGSACSSGSTEPSAVLMAIGFSREEAMQTVRFSFPWDVSLEQVASLQECVLQLLRLQHSMG